MDHENLAVDQLTTVSVSRFLDGYRSEQGRLPTASVWPLLDYLRSVGQVPPEPPSHRRVRDQRHHHMKRRAALDTPRPERTHQRRRLPS